MIPKELPKKKRVRPGRSQERRIWDESGSRCQLCGALGTTKLQIHHLDENPENTKDENLIAICGSCHERYKHGQITQNDVYRLKFALLSGNPPFPILSKEVEKPKHHINEPKFVATDIVGLVQQAESITNKINYGETLKGPIILPGTIASNPLRYNYMEYLIKKLSEWRSKGVIYGQKQTGKIHPGVIRKQIDNEWHGLPKDLPLEKWESLCNWLKTKIDNTALGRNNRSKGTRNYHSFEEHG